MAASVAYRDRQKLERKRAANRRAENRSDHNLCTSRPDAHRIHSGHIPVRHVLTYTAGVPQLLRDPE
jgi:hypothetical protein